MTTGRVGRKDRADVIAAGLGAGVRRLDGSAGGADEGDGNDGRHQRKSRNRELVLDAALSLFADGVIEPTAQELSERAGVSLRSVYRYFDDRSDLVRATIARTHELAMPLFELANVDHGSRTFRVRRLAASRVALFERMGPMMRAVARSIPTNELIIENRERNRLLLRNQVLAMFAAEISMARGEPSGTRSGALEDHFAGAGELSIGLEHVFSFATFDELRLGHGLSVAETESVMSMMAIALVDRFAPESSPGQNSLPGPMRPGGPRATTAT